VRRQDDAVVHGQLPPRTDGPESTAMWGSREGGTTCAITRLSVRAGRIQDLRRAGRGRARAQSGRCRRIHSRGVCRWHRADDDRRSLTLHRDPRDVNMLPRSMSGGAVLSRLRRISVATPRRAQERIKRARACDRTRESAVPRFPRRESRRASLAVIGHCRTKTSSRLPRVLKSESV